MRSITGAPPRRHDDAHGLLPHEAAILARTDAGDDPRVVACDMGVAVGTVVSIANKYGFGIETQAQRERLIRAASRRLAAVAAATGGRFA